MLWIIQNNLLDEGDYRRLLDAIERLNVEHMIVKIIPFTNQILPAVFDSMTQDIGDADGTYVDPSKKIIVMGSIALSRIAKHKGWTPGTYLNNNFDFEVWRAGYGANNILNGDAIVTKISDDIDVTEMSDHLFVRPVLDTKSFAGTVVSKYDFFDWVQTYSMVEEEEFQPLHKNTKIAIANYKKIIAEYRIFVVNGKVVTGSLYKRGGEHIQVELNDYNVSFFASCMINRWQPADAFVIDIAETDDGYKIIEINNINAAGFYASDCQKIVSALEDFGNYYKEVR